MTNKLNNRMPADSRICPRRASQPAGQQHANKAGGKNAACGTVGQQRRQRQAGKGDCGDLHQALGALGSQTLENIQGPGQG